VFINFKVIHPHWVIEAIVSVVPIIAITHPHSIIAILHPHWII
jgi:hypothetical protein